MSTAERLVYLNTVSPMMLDRSLRVFPLPAMIAALIAVFTMSPGLLTAAEARGESAGAEDADTSASSAGEWEFETVELKNGTVYHGLIQVEGKEEIELVEVVRPPGKPMFAVVRPVATEDVAGMRRLEPPERARLIERIAQFRARARIEAGRMQDVQLRQEAVDSMPRWVYDGIWFRLESTTDEEMTRRVVVRIEQIFRAYRQVLQPT
ncbi:MAG: hypothetical protein JJ992_30625, partial [Planctomycetes bacterium]|nr:hypothetical protein [Planctomycetota bacterium]